MNGLEERTRPVNPLMSHQSSQKIYNQNSTPYAFTSLKSTGEKILQSLQLEGHSCQSEIKVPSGSECTEIQLIYHHTKGYFW